MHDMYFSACNSCILLLVQIENLEDLIKEVTGSYNNLIMSMLLLSVVIQLCVWFNLRLISTTSWTVVN